MSNFKTVDDELPLKHLLTLRDGKKLLTHAWALSQSFSILVAFWRAIKVTELQRSCQQHCPCWGWTKSVASRLCTQIPPGFIPQMWRVCDLNMTWIIPHRQTHLFLHKVTSVTFQPTTCSVGRENQSYALLNTSYLLVSNLIPTPIWEHPSRKSTGGE